VIVFRRHETAANAEPLQARGRIRKGLVGPGVECDTGEETLPASQGRIHVIARVSSGRRAGQRFDATRGVTTEGLIFLGDLDPEAVGPGIVYATHYEPTPVGDLTRLLDAVPLPPEQTTFVDLGSGMGRAVMVAADRGYRQAVGVEISPALHEVARENVRAISRESAKRIRLVRRDASSFRIPRGDLALYLFNPFRAVVMETVVANLLARAGRSEVVIVYHTPLERAVIDATGAFEQIADLGFGIVYLRRLPCKPNTVTVPCAGT
jgi:SAM-dependent methyltransferase